MCEAHATGSVAIARYSAGKVDLPKGLECLRSHAAVQCRQVDFAGYVRACQAGIANARVGDQNAPTDMGSKQRWLLVIAALVAASAFALSVQAGRWWTIDDITVGPLGAHSPFGGPGGLSWTGGSPRWERLGAATWAGGMIAMFVLIVLAGGLAARRIPRLAARTAIVAIATAMLAGAGFVATRPENGLPFALDRGAALFAIGIVIGALAAAGVLRVRPPA